ncbi:hypothetical protein [Mucilaginibacter terrae]|uniref:hypothetical protein n=1 Tax=Mucilaginibacter terrae TaxID=1955052 RepID=UPI002899BCA2|nr:hypothetical protein [Mucilaginibacter terrae]
MTVIILILISVKGYAQHIAETFQEAEKKGYSMQKLDGEYASALHADSTKAVFKGGRSQEFYKAYANMLNTLAVYLNKNNFVWEKPTRIFNRIYFEPDGCISYYLVNLENTGLTASRQKQFITLVNNFIQDYKIEITGNSRFAQCSPVMYQNSK